MTTNETPMTEEQKFICEECENIGTYCQCKEHYFMIKIYDKDGKIDSYWEDEETCNYWCGRKGEDEADQEFDKAIRFYETLKNDEGEYDRWVIELVMERKRTEFPKYEEEIVIDDFVVNGEN